MAISQEDILNLVRNGLADLRGEKQDQSKLKTMDYATPTEEQDTNSSDDLDFFDAAWLTSEQQTSNTQDLAPPPPPPPPPQTDLSIPTMPPPGLMLQTNLINAITQYRSRSEYYAARQVRNIGYSMLGQENFDRALESAGIRNLPRQDKPTSISGNLMALEALVLVWEEMVCLGGSEHANYVKGAIEELYGQGVLRKEEARWRDGVKVGVRERR